MDIHNLRPRPTESSGTTILPACELRGTHAERLLQVDAALTALHAARLGLVRSASTGLQRLPRRGRADASLALGLVLAGGVLVTFLLAGAGLLPGRQADGIHTTRRSVMSDMHVALTPVTAVSPDSKEGVHD